MNTHTTKYMCKKCGIRCQSSNALEVHKRSHSGKKPFKCTVCKKRFITSSHLVQHNRIHSGEKPFKCQMCDKVFMQSGERNNHMLLHTGEKPHKCSLCDKSFRLTTTLQSHMDRIHTNSRLHQCPFCGKKFKMNHDLKQHVRIHTDTRRHSCRHCSERFLWSIQLKKHLLEAHREGTWIICNFCRTKFVSRSDLNRHVRRHHWSLISWYTPLSNTLAAVKLHSRSFKHRQSLLKHFYSDKVKQCVRRHEGVKPRICIDCPDRFLCTASVLKSCQLVYSNVNVFDCVCVCVFMLEISQKQCFEAL